MIRPSPSKSAKLFKWAVPLMIFVGLLLLGYGMWGLSRAFRFAPQAAYPPLRLSVDIWPGNFWVIVAEKKGYFKEVGLPVELVDVSKDYFQSIQDLRDGKAIDAGLITPFDLVQQNTQKGGDLVGILYTDRSLSAEGIVSKPEIETLSQLAGKRVGVETGSYLDYYLTVALGTVGLSDSDIIKVGLLTDNMVETFGTENLDAAILWDPVLSEVLKQYGAKTLLTADQIKGLSWSVWAVPRSLILSRKDDLYKMVQAWRTATDLLLSHPDEALGLVSDFHFASEFQPSYSVDELKAMVLGDPLMDLNSNLSAFSFSSGIESIFSNLQSVARYFQSLDPISPLADTNRMIDSRFVRTLNNSEFVTPQP